METKSQNENADYFNPESTFLVEKMSYEKNRFMNSFHFHNCYELFFLLEGQRTYVVDNNTLSISQHDILCLPPNIFHRSIGTTPYTRYVLYFEDSFLAKYYTPASLPLILETINARVISLADQDFQYAISLLKTLERLQLEENPLGIYSYFTMLLSLLHNNIGHPKEISVNTLDQNIHEILQYINEHFAQIDHIDLIADTFHISKYYLCRIFKEYTGVTIVQYITNVKMKHSCELLLHTNLSITAISEQCGFHTSMYFNNVFKKEFGMTPREYRMQAPFRQGS